MGTKRKFVKIKCVGFFKRLLACLIDGLVLSPIFLIPYLLQIQVYNIKYFVLYVAITSLSHLYTILLPVFFGGTIGKIIMKIKIVNKNGSHINFNQSLIRWSPYIISFILAIVLLLIPFQSLIWYTVKGISSLFSYFVFLEAFVLIFNPDRRTIHDYMASTYVVEK